MKLIFRVAAGVIIGLLSVQAIQLWMLDYHHERSVTEGKSVNQLLNKATLLKNSLYFYYERKRILPKYVSDLDCSLHGLKKCALGQQDSKFYISSGDHWMAIRPYLNDDKIKYFCETTLSNDLILDPSFKACSQVRDRDIPAFDRPTFDCSKATRKVETLICESDRLAELDIKLVKSYKNKLSSSAKSIREKLKSSQIAFIKKRYQTCDDADCIDKLTKERIEEIERAFR